MDGKKYSLKRPVGVIVDNAIMCLNAVANVLYLFVLQVHGYTFGSLQCDLTQSLTHITP